MNLDDPTPTPDEIAEAKKRRDSNPSNRTTDTFEIVQVEGDESQFTDFLEFIETTQNGSEIIHQLRANYDIDRIALKLYGATEEDLENSPSVAFDAEDDDGQKYFNIYSPEPQYDQLRLVDLEKIFDQLTYLDESDFKVDSGFLIISFNDENGIRPLRIDYLRLNPEMDMDDRNQTRDVMKFIEEAGTTKVLAIKLQTIKPE